jgi:hypothetical protein
MQPIHRNKKMADVDCTMILGEQKTYFKKIPEKK